MKNLKKIMAVLFSVLLIFTAIPTFAFAKNVEVKSGKTYSVPVKMMNATHPEKESMGNKAIDGNALVKVGEGKTEYIVTFKGIEFAGKFGHLRNLYCYTDKAQDIKEPAKKVEVFTDTDLEGGTSEFPRKFSITRNHGKEDNLDIHIDVDAMDGFPQDAIFAFDWTKAQEVGPVVKTYSVDVKLMNATKPEQVSMGAGALRGHALVKEYEGKTEYILTFTGLQVSTLYGLLQNMAYYENQPNEKTKTPVKVIEKYFDKDLNNSQSEFPKRVCITREKAMEDKIYIEVQVDAMPIPQDALLVFNIKDKTEIFKGNADVARDTFNAVNAADLLEILSNYGVEDAIPSDIDQNGVVNSADLLSVLSQYGKKY